MSVSKKNILGTNRHVKCHDLKIVGFLQVIRYML